MSCRTGRPAIQAKRSSIDGTERLWPKDAPNDGLEGIGPRVRLLPSEKSPYERGLARRVSEVGCTDALRQRESELNGRARPHDKP